MEERQITSTRYITPQTDNTPTVQEYQKQKAVFRTYNFIWLLIGVIETLLGFRFVLEILGANPYSGFTQLVYGLSYPFAAPFQSMFGMTVVARSVFDWSILVGAAVYLLIGYGLVQLLRIIKPITPQDANQKVSAV